MNALGEGSTTDGRPDVRPANQPGETPIGGTTDGRDARHGAHRDAHRDARHGEDRDDGWRTPPERARRAWLVGEAISCAAILAVCGVATAVCVANGWWGFWPRLVVALAAAYAVLDLAFQPLQTKYAYTFYRFRIGERDLRTRRGWMFRRSTAVPYNRVQHVDTKQNPVLRHFGLTTVVVHTAADALEIEALDTAEAERMVALITERVASAKDDL